MQVPQCFTCNCRLAQTALSRPNVWQVASVAQHEAKWQEQEREQRRRRREERGAPSSPRRRSQSRADQHATTYDTETINPYRSPRLASLAAARESLSLAEAAGTSQLDSPSRRPSPKRSPRAQTGSVRSSPRRRASETPLSSSTSPLSSKSNSTADADQAASPTGSRSSPKKSPRAGSSLSSFSLSSLLLIYCPGRLDRISVSVHLVAHLWVLVCPC